MLEYLNKNKQWIFSGIGVFILGGIISIGWELFGPKSLIIATTDNLKETTAKTITPWPAISTIATNSSDSKKQLRDDIRIRNGVKKLEPIDNELTFINAPCGVYGYSYIGYLFDLSKLKLECNESSFSQDFEIHKKNDGTCEIIGFVSSDVGSHLSRSDRQKNYSFTLYNHTWSAAPNIVSIPLRVIDLNLTSIIGRTIPQENNKNIEAFDITLK